MDEKISEYGSDRWIKDLRILGEQLEKTLKQQPGGSAVSFDGNLFGTKEKPGKIVEEYHETVDQFKIDIFGKDASKSFVNHNKIAALYIRSILKHRPFSIKEEYYGQSLNVQLANEYYIILYLSSIFKGWGKNCKKQLNIDPRYKFEFIKLLHYYQKNIDRLDLLSLTNIICLLEKHYFKS